MEDGINVMKDLGLQSHSLVPLNKHAWDILLEDNVITPEIYKNLRQRMEDKYTWAIKMLRSSRGLETLANLFNNPNTKEKAMKIIRNYETIEQELRKSLAKKLDINMMNI